MSNRKVRSFEEHMAVLGDKRNSLTYWYPKIQGLVRTPETIIVPIKATEYWHIFDGAPMPEKDLPMMYEAAVKLGYPVFMRTSQSSDKHGWKDTCYLPKKKDLRKHLFSLLEHDAMADLMADAIVFRKYIPMESYFTAFYGDFPVNKEMRCFINKGKLECVHPYWPKAAIKQGEHYIKDKDWESKFHLITEFSPADMDEVRSMLEKVIPQFGGEWWSVDFAKSADGQWYLIDMALGLASYHADGCPHSP